MIFLADVEEGLKLCSQKLQAPNAMDFIKIGAEKGMDTQYKITIKKCRNKEGYTVTMSVKHISQIITLHNISGLPMEVEP
jgi:hypothetical protein